MSCHHCKVTADEDTYFSHINYWSFVMDLLYWACENELVSVEYDKANNLWIVKTTLRTHIFCFEN